MANYANLKAQIDANIYQNDSQAVTGAILNAQLKAMVDALGAGYQFMGVATPSTNPGTPDQKVFYLAAQPGTYTNFVDSSSNAIVVNDGEVCALLFGTSWSKQVTGTAVIVSQNTSTGHTDIQVGDTITPVPSVAEMLKNFATRTNFSIVGGNAATTDVLDSITVSGTNITVKFKSPILAIGNVVSENQYAYVSATVESSGYVIQNAYALVFDFDTKAFTTTRLITIDDIIGASSGQKVIVIANLYGHAVSPIPSIQSEILRLTIPTVSTAVATPIANAKSFRFNASAYGENGFALIYSFTSGTAHIFSNAFKIYHAILGVEISIPSHNNTTIASGSSYVYDTVAGSASVKADSALLDTDIVVFANIGGKLCSPIPELDNAIQMCKGSELANCIIRKGVTACFRYGLSLSVSRLGNNLTVTMSAFNLALEDSQYGYIGFPAQEDVQINNTYALVFDVDSATASVKNANAIKPTDIVVLYNEYGILYSPIASIQTEIYHYYNPMPTPDPEPTVTVVTVAESGGDFTSVRDAVSSITDASAQNRYKIFIENGTYNEIDIKTKDYVDIEGESKEGVILYTDGLSTENAPDDYNWHTSEYGGAPINTIPKAWKHLFIHCSNSEIRNLTMKVRMCKYCVHQDNASNPYTAIVRNCLMIREESYNDNNASERQLYYIVGVGAESAQFQKYYDCDFVFNMTDTPSTYFPGGFVWHNWYNGNAVSGLVLDGCNFYGFGHMGTIFNLRSTGVMDEVEMVNCVADSERANSIILYTSDTTAHPAAQGALFNIRVNVDNCPKLRAIADDGFNTKYVERALNAYTMVKKCVSASVLRGQPIVGTNDNFNGNVGVGVASSTPFVVAMEDASSGDFCFCNKGDLFTGLCVAGTYAAGDDIYINNGKFTSTQSGDPVGKVVEAKTLSSDGLVLISKV